MKKTAAAFLLSFFSTVIFAQQIVYSPTESQDRAGSSIFNIIGKVKQNVLIFKLHNRDAAVSVYDDATMQLKQRVELSFLPKSKIISIYFLPYADYSWMIYAYHERNYVFCIAVKMDENAKLLGAPQLLDSAKIKVEDDPKIYSVTRSTDHSKIMILKIQNRDYDPHLYFTALVYNDNFTLLRKSQLEDDFNYKEEQYRNFCLDNEGDIAFTKEKRPDFQTYAGGYISHCTLFVNQPGSNTFSTHTFNLSGKLMQDVILKADNVNDHFVMNAFYSSGINIEGLYTSVFDLKDLKWVSANFTSLGQGILALAKSDNEKINESLNDYYIQNIILKKDGGFIVTAEKIRSNYKTVSAGNSPNRSPSWMLYDTYQKNRDFLENMNDVYVKDSYQYSNYGNILILDADNKGNLNWGNVIHKSQYPLVNGQNYFSYLMMLANGSIDFLFNRPYQQKWILNSESVTPDGNVIENKLLWSLREKYIFLPAEGKQVRSDEIIIPCLYKQHYCFTKIVPH